MTIWPPPLKIDQESTDPPNPSASCQFLDWLFAIPTGDRNIWTIIWWWELRRIPYNLIVGSVGVCSLILFFFFITHSGTLGPGEDAEEPLGIIVIPFLMNFCYSLGAFLELFLFWLNREQTRNVGPNLLKAGLIFSLSIVLLPSVIWGIVWMRHVL